ncbi:MAG: lipopolysaccharide transport periplasmic protein LptA [Sulfurovum sp.]|nr:lipopolysaccharide transport periplasmic protein LptA [Sulfurovum sp.]
MKLFNVISHYIFVFLVFSILNHAEKVEIVSDDMYAQNIKKEVHFMGNVKIKQDKNWIHADKVIVYFNENNETNKYEALENVKFEFKDMKNHYKGSTDSLIYLPIKSKYTLTGKSIIDDIENKRHINGDIIILDMISGNAKVHGNKKKPVKFIFDMESAK